MKMAAARSSICDIAGRLARARGGAARDATREDAAAEERALERAIPMDAATAESRDLARGEEAGERTTAAEGATVEVCLDAAERLASEDPEAHGDEWSGLRVEHAMRTRNADELVGDVLPRLAHGRELRVRGRR